MNETLLTLFLVFNAAVFGQDAEDQITNWRRSHPTVAIMDQVDYSKLTDDQKSLIGNSVLLIDGKLTIEDIQAYEFAHQQNIKSPESSEIDSRVAISNEFSSEIKTWLFHHPGIKIISQSYYDSLTEQDRALYDHPMVLIISGKVVTIEDIGNYEDMY